MQTVVHLKVVNHNLTIECPYTKRDVPAVVCFTGQRAPTHPYCYRCPDGEVFERNNQARVFKRVVVPEGSPDNVVWVRVKVNSKKTGITHTYAKYKEGVVTMPFNETIRDYRLDVARLNDGRTITSPYPKEHHGLLSESDLNILAQDAESERKNMRSSGIYHGKSGGKKMIGSEMKSLIEDRKRRDSIEPKPSGGNWYTNLRDREKAKNAGKPVVSSLMKGKPKKVVVESGFGFKAKKRVTPESTSSLISDEARRLTKKRG